MTFKKKRFKKVIRDLQRRFSILLQYARDRVATAAKTVIASRLWSAMQTCSDAHQLQIYVTGMADLVLYNTIKWSYQPKHSPSTGMAD